MEIITMLKDLIAIQELGVNLQETPVLIFLEDGSIYYCFIELETENYLGVMLTTAKGTEHAKIINKDWISSIEIVYQDTMKQFEQPNKIIGYE